MIPRTLVLTAAVLVRKVEAKSWSPKKRGREPLGSYEQNPAAPHVQTQQHLSQLLLPEEDKQKRQEADHILVGDENVGNGFTDPSALSDPRISGYKNEGDDKDICLFGSPGLQLTDESKEDRQNIAAVPLLIASRTRDLQEIPDFPLRHLNEDIFVWSSPSAQDPSPLSAIQEAPSNQQSHWLFASWQDKAASGLTQNNNDKSRSFDLVRINCNVAVESLTWSFAFGSIWPFACQMMGSASSAFIGMSRLILTMGLIQQGFLKMYEILQDWYVGRYIRISLEDVQRRYSREYQVPAVFRSVGRLVVHMTILFLMGSMMENLVGLAHKPCHLNKEGGGCHWWCSFLWLLASASTGHAAGAAIAIWGQGLRIQIEATTNGRPSGRRILRRPWQLIRYICDPGKWFREVLAGDPNRVAEPFNPDWRLFPATSMIVRILQLAAVAKEMYGSDKIMHKLMRLTLIQQAFGDEWFRVLMCEKRVALGIGVMVGYLVSTLSLLFKIVNKPVSSVSSVSILLVAPSIIAVALSAWMNVLAFLSRRKQTLRAADNNASFTIEEYKRVNGAF